MTDINTIFRNGLNFLQSQGINTTITQINYTISDSDYDDVTTQTIGGSGTISGLVFPVRGTQGSYEAMLLEQGKIRTNDKHLYLLGSINLSGNLIFDINGEKYTLIPDGIRVWENAGSHIYSEAFVRFVVGGSLF